MHTFAGDVDGMRRTVAIVHTDAFDDEDTQGLVLVQINSVHEMMLEPVGSYLLVKWDQGIKALADCRAPTNAVMTRRPVCLPVCLALMMLVETSC